MQKLLLVLVALCCVGCSSARDNATREKIRSEYSKKDKKDKKSKSVSKSNAKSTKGKTERLEATSKVSVTNIMVQEYIDTYKFVAMENMKMFGIPASIKLAQGILESGSGTGTLSREANNHFGIKCASNWEGESVAFTDDAPDECFRKYKSPLESFSDHSNFLVNRSRYQQLFSLDKKDYVAWANGLKNAGYATDPKYAQKLIDIIERHELYKYDNLVLGNDYKYEVPKKQKIDYSNEYKITQGDTLYSISRRFNMSVDELKEINNISDNNIKIGQTLKVK
ncbi:glucosaminidase domain-containing protein [Flavobacterium sp. I3-2]|uniref:glucosaminidase domain-containing protein n=1 Tax=Flavobacterium sp. I3-2 TaxID=2748319 RepID=UPI0015B0FD97|nr:glucosaminidase domain-containing protein [Flavobacterium sp. I3-2]